MRSTIQQTEAWRLDVELISTEHGHALRFTSLVPHARRPEKQTQLLLVLTDSELQSLQKFFTEAVASATI